MKFPAKYSQLPNYDYEYYKIIKDINYKINKNDFENIVSNIKNAKTKDKYKHRTNLENLGLISTENGMVDLTDIGQMIRIKKISMEKGLRTLISQNHELVFIFNQIKLTGYFNNIISKKDLINELHEKIYKETTKATIGRYIVPIINLFEISNYKEFETNTSIVAEKKIIKETQEKNLDKLEKAYLSISREYEKVIALEKIEKILITEYKLNKKQIVCMWKNIYDNINLRYKFNLITLPSWGTKYKGIKLRGQIFTHIIIYK